MGKREIFLVPLFVDSFLSPVKCKQPGSFIFFPVSKDHTLLNFLKETELSLKPNEILRLKNTVVKSLDGK